MQTTPVAKKTKATAKAKTKSKAKPTKKPAKAKAEIAVVSADIAPTCTAIESYFKTLRAKDIDGLDVFDATLEPQKAKAIAAIEKELAFTLPADVKEFLARGLKGGSGSFDKDDAFAGVGFEWNDAEQIVEHTKMLREIAKDNDDEQARIIATGIALTSEEPELVIAKDGSVHHWSFRNPKLQVAKSFAEFLAHWAASGCHSSHTFHAVWPLVRDLAPVSIAPKQNLWLKAYKKQFPEHVSFS